MSWTWYSNTAPSYPQLKPVKLQPPSANGKPRWREWGRSEPAPITITLKTARAAPTPTEPSHDRQLDPESYPQSGRMQWVMKHLEEGKDK
jgi:hypothetical protein